MAASDSTNHLDAFQAARGDLLALAYRMLGDLGRAEDMLQDAWLRWESTREKALSPRAYLVTIVTRLCLNELDSARCRKEESRSDRLPEPVAAEALEASGLWPIDRGERLERVSMAFGVVLQRLTPAERAVLLLHDVFDFDHDELAALVGKTAPACRKLLERARRDVRDARRMLETSPDEHRRLLHAFVAAAAQGDVSSLLELLAPDAVLVTDGGEAGRGALGLKNLRKPLAGADHVAAFIVAASARAADLLAPTERMLNGQPAIVFYEGDRPWAALLLGVADGKIQRVFFHADLRRLGHVGRASGRT